MSEIRYCLGKYKAKKLTKSSPMNTALFEFLEKAIFKGCSYEKGDRIITGHRSFYKKRKNRRES